MIRLLSIVTLTVLGLVATELDAFEVTPRGRLHLDHATHDDDARELGEQSRVRRARLGLSGKIDDDWSFIVEYDFAENSTTANDVYLRYSGWRAGSFTIGHFKVPFGLEELASSNTFSLIERPLPVAAFAPSRRLGIGFDTAGAHWTLSVMGFGQSSGSGVRSGVADEGLGLAARWTYTPIDRDQRLLHLAVAATSEAPEDKDLRQMRFSTRPESRPTDVRLVDTGSIEHIDRIQRIGAEIAWQSGPLLLQGEWLRVSASRRNDEPDVAFAGWYLNAGWFLTGEQRDYRSGVFRGITPNSGKGAWELVARYSSIGLNDGPVLGGTQRNWTAGINWYANAHVRFMANLIQVNSCRQGVDDDPSILLLRAQVAF